MRQLCARAYRAICEAVGSNTVAGWAKAAAASPGRTCELLEARVLLSTVASSAPWADQSPANVAGDPVLWAQGTATVWSSSPAQSTAGPTPGQADAWGGVSAGGISGIHTVAGVPAYLWHDGCGPTATGMIMGYWDGKGFPNLIPGDASTQTAAVNDAITSPEHYSDYALPMDEYSSAPIPDKSSTGGAHANNSIGDWMRTSWSAAGNQYGWSWLDDVPGAMTGYASYMGYKGSSTSTLTYSQMPWSTLTSEIDAGRPIGFLVDSSGDGQTDHFITVIGYGLDNGVPSYECYNTWDSSAHWYDYQPMSSSYSFGVYGAVLFNPGSSVEPTIDSLSASPTTLTVGDNLTLTAKNVTQAGGTINSVSFYLESNNTPGLQTGTNGDTWVKGGVQNGADWSASISTANLTTAGPRTYYALASGSSGNTTPMGTSAPAATITVAELATNMRLDATATSSVFGQQLTFTATVTAMLGTPGGTVDFYDGTTLLGSVLLDAKGTAAFATNGLSAGNHSITAIYEGNASFQANDTLDNPLPVTITPATLTVTGLTLSDKVYDGTTNVTLNTANLGLAGLVAGHTVTLNTKAITVAFADKNVGTNKAIVIKGVAISGSEAGNYTLIQPVATASITARAISITANVQSKTYGAADPTLTYRFTSGTLATGERLTGTLSRQAGEHPGVYQIVQGSLTGGGNYNLTFTGADLTVRRAPLQIVADNKTKTYGAEVPALTVTYIGFVAGDTAASLTAQPTLSTTATALSPVSATAYSITASGAAADDYTISYVAGQLTVVPCATTTDLRSSNDTTRSGQAVVLTATVTPSVAGTLPGTVDFQVDGVSIATVAILGGTATCTTGALGVGIHSVVAAYSGGGNFAASHSSSLSQTVSRVVPTITWPAPAAITYGTSLSAAQLNAAATDSGTGASIPGTFSYSVAAGTVLHAAAQQISVTFTPTNTAYYESATASVQLVVNKAVLTAAAQDKTRAYRDDNPALTVSPFTGLVNHDLRTVISGAPILATDADVTTAAGTYPISITQGTLAADDYTFNLIPGNLVITKAATTTSIATNNPSAVFGQSITLTATVTPPAGTAATGTVQFQIDGTNVGSPVALSGNTATRTTAAPAIGNHSITATYSGDGNFSASSASLVQSVSRVIPAINWAAAAITYGTPLGAAQLDATAADSSTGAILAGTFTYSDVAGSVLHSGMRQLSVTFTPANIAYYQPVTGSVQLLVNRAILTSTAQDKTRAYGIGNPALTFSPLTGLVNGDLPAVVTGAPSLTTAADATTSPGVYPITMTQGTLAADDYAFNLIAGKLTITKAATATAVTTNNATAVSGQSITFTATVTPTAGAAPGGTVQFQIDAVNAGGPVPLTGGTAGYTTSQLLVAGHRVVAIYSGDANFSPSTSGVLKQNVAVDLAPTGLTLSKARIAENQPAGTLVGTLTAIDPNAGDTFRYKLVTGDGSTDNASFTIDGNQLKTAAQFNYELRSTYSIRVRVIDQANVSFDKVFAINVINVNEAPTNVRLSSAAIAENQPAGTLVGTLAAVDPDAGNTFTYVLVDGDTPSDNAAFKLVGNQLVSAQPFNYELKSSYTVRVRATDQAGLSVDKLISVQVTNVNEAPTDISPGIAYSVLEGQPIGTLVGTLKGVDPDAGSVLTYSLATGTGSKDNALFTITGAKLRTAGSLSYAAGSTRKIRVRVTDQNQLWFEKVLLITVLSL